MKVLPLLLASLPVAHGMGGITFSADNGVMYMCGDQISGDTMCAPPDGISYFHHLDEDGPECQALIDLAEEDDDAIFGSRAPEFIIPDSDPPIPAALGYIHTYTEYKGYQGYRCTRQGCNECVCNAPDGKCGGDPHFSTYDGTQYSYHGECDLVMARSKIFANGLGLDLHIRTKGMGSWSLISNAVLRVGDETFEFVNDGTHYINGKAFQPLPKKLAGRYQITKERNIIEKEMADGSIQTIDKTTAVVHFDGDKEVRFTRLGKGIMYVKVNLNLADTEGMLGSFKHKGLVGRDGVLLSTGDEMGEHWQVNGTEPMLFHEIRAPQWPQKCIPPTANAQQRRLRMSEFEIQQAQEVCSAVEDDHRMFCVEDVLLSGDPASANGYVFGEAF